MAPNHLMDLTGEEFEQKYLSELIPHENDNQKFKDVDET